MARAALAVIVLESSGSKLRYHRVVRCVKYCSLLSIAVIATACGSFKGVGEDAPDAGPSSSATSSCGAPARTSNVTFAVTPSTPTINQTFTVVVSYEYPPGSAFTSATLTLCEAAGPKLLTVTNEAIDGPTITWTFIEEGGIPTAGTTELIFAGLDGSTIAENGTMSLDVVN